MVGWLVVCLLGWLVGWLVGWLADWLAGWLAGWLVGWLVGCLTCVLVILLDLVISWSSGACGQHPWIGSRELRFPGQNGISQASYIVEIYRSAPKLISCLYHECRNEGSAKMALMQASGGRFGEPSPPPLD